MVRPVGDQVWTRRGGGPVVPQRDPYACPPAVRGPQQRHDGGVPRALHLPGSASVVCINRHGALILRKVPRRLAARLCSAARDRSAMLLDHHGHVRDLWAQDPLAGRYRVRVRGDAAQPPISSAAPVRGALASVSADSGGRRRQCCCLVSVPGDLSKPARVPCLRACVPACLPACRPAAPAWLWLSPHCSARRRCCYITC
jgi:hypothetical protein